MKIVIGGQLRKNEIKNLVLKHDPNALVTIMSDIEAAMAVQDGKYDVYLGACDTGGGGALAMAISLLGFDKAKTIATISSIKSENEIKEMVKNGVVAFGFVENSIESSIEKIMNALKEKQNE